VTALGVTGEATRLTERERHLVVDTVVRQVNGRARVIVGASADGVRTCIGFSREAKTLGASAVMVSPPRALKLNTEAVMAHYKALSEAVDLPIVVQDYPPISGFAMEEGLLARIAREIPAARTVKLEDPPTPFKQLDSRGGGETKVAILGGLGGVFLPRNCWRRGQRDDRVCLSGSARAGRVALPGGPRDEAADVFIVHRSCASSFRKGSAWRSARRFRRRGALADGSHAPGPRWTKDRAALDRMLA
jgi:4-hydroxy-tetrahydrodipicolinate synthase